MNIGQTVLGLVGIGVVITMGGLTGLNFYLHNNVSYETDDKKVVKKADGIMTHTTLEIDKDNGAIKITRNNFLTHRTYTDNDNDGNVDNIFRTDNPFVRGSYPRTFERDKHLKQYPSLFEKADRDFRQQIKRFKPFLNR